MVNCYKIPKDTQKIMAVTGDSHRPCNSEHVDEHSGSAIEGGALLLRHSLHTGGSVKGGGRENHRAPVDHCIQVADDTAQAVVEGRGTADACIFLMVAHSQSDHVGVVHNVVVGERRPLWASSGARGELDVGWVVPDVQT